VAIHVLEKAFEAFVYNSVGAVLRSGKKQFINRGSRIANPQIKTLKYILTLNSTLSPAFQCWFKYRDEGATKSAFSLPLGITDKKAMVMFTLHLAVINVLTDA
jgi:hypothetical protein